MRPQDKVQIDVSSFRYAKFFDFGKGLGKLLRIHLLIVSWLSLSVSSSFGQDSSPWATRAGGTGLDQTLGVSARLADGSAIVTGFFDQPATFGVTTLTTAGNRDVFVAKINAAGALAPPTQIAVNAGNNQGAWMGTAVATAPSVIVRDASNNPVSGVSVTFAVATGGGSLAASGTVTTNNSGIATSPAWTLGTTAGANTLTATSTGLTGSPLTFTATAVVGASTQVWTSRTTGVSASVTNKALTANVATLTTGSAHNITVGMTAVVAGVDATFNGSYTVTGVPTSTTFTYARTAADVASTAATGTVTADNQWLGVAYGDGLWVAVANTGTGNRVMTSPNGITWTARTSAADNSWRSVAHNGLSGDNGLWVAVAESGTGNRVMTSPDGITWTARTSAADNGWNGVAYGNGLWVAVALSGSSNRVMTSPDGINWTLRTSAANNVWRSVAHNGLSGDNGLWVAVAESGTGNRVMTSPDGNTWTIRTSAADNGWHGVAYANGLWVAVALSGTGDRVMTSPDGITWTARTSAADKGWLSVAYGNGLWVAVANTGTGNRVMTMDWRPTQIAVNAGNSQSATVGSSVATAPSVLVRDTNGNPVEGVGVYFAVASGGGTLTGENATTNASGIATLGSWTLGAAAGANTLTATVGGLTGSPVTFTATGTGPPTQLSLNSPANLIAGGSRAAYTVTRRDANNNATTLGGALTIHLSTSGTSGVFYDAATDGAAIVSLTIAAGQSSANFHFAATTAGNYTITASDATPPDGATGLMDASDEIAITAGAATKMTINTGNNQSATVASEVFFAPSVLVQDANNNGVQGVPVSIQVHSGAGTMYPALMSNITPDYSEGGSTITQGSWKAILFTNGTSSVKIRGVSLVLNNITTTYPANIGVKVAIYSVTGGNPDLQLATSDDRVISLSNHKTWTKFLLNSELQLSPGTTYALVVKGLDNTGFKWANTRPSTNPMMYGTASYVDAKSATNGVWASANGNNGFALVMDPGETNTLNLTTSPEGIVSLGAWTLGTTAGTNTLTATSTGLTGSPLTFTATGTAGAATQIAIHAGNNQTATVGTVVPVAPAVIVKDVHNNPVAGVNISFSVASGGGSVTSASATTDAAGIATPGSWTLGTAAGTNTLTATSTGLTGSPLTFTAEAISRPGKPAQLSATPSDRQISISFTPAADGGTVITNYEYSLDEGLTWIAFNPAKTSSPLIITGLNNGIRYPVQIRALNSVGAGISSDVVYATPSKSIADLSVSITNVTYTGQQQQVKPTIKDGQTTLTENTDYTLSYSNNINAGTASVSISGINRYSGLRQESFSISRASLSISADAKSKVYGEVNPTLSYRYTGLVNGETKIATEPTISTTANTSSGVGKYPISLSGGTDPNYTIRLIDAELTVTAATLSITADAKSKILGRADPVFTYQVSGLKLNDLEADVLSGTLTRQAGEKPGRYTISQGTLSANANYTISFTAADLTITAAQILSFVDLGILETAWGKNQTLPAQVQVLTTNGQFIPMDISWNVTGLNIFARGVYVISGTITLSDGIVNPLGVRPTATIRVLPKAPPQNLTLSNNRFEGSTTTFNIVIGRLIVIDPVDAVHTLSLTGTAADNRYFTITNNVLYWNSSDRAEGRERFNVRITLTDRDGNRIEREFEIIRTRKTLQSIQIPNTFTPNGDGVNDTWGVAEIRFFEGTSIQIFERSGQRLFLTINPDKGWNGTNNGKPLPVGTYYWIIQIKETGEVRKGVLNLIR